MSTNINLTMFIKEPNTFEAIRCRICGSVCKVERNALGPTCYAEGICGRNRLHDRFECPHIGEVWHNRCMIQYKALKTTGDSALTELARRDLLSMASENAGTQAAAWLKDSLDLICDGSRLQEE